MEIDEPGSAPLDLLAMGELYSTYDLLSSWDSDWSDPRLDGTRGFHNHLDTFSDPNSEFWVSVTFPSDETLLVKKMDL